MAGRIFQIVSVPVSAFWVIFGVALFCFALALFFAYMAISSRTIIVEVQDQGLKIKGGLYGRFIQKDSIIKENIAILDLHRHPEYRPTRRTNGLGLPGFKLGWFKLKNGEKALLFLTDVSHVVYFPTRDGYSVLISPAQPRELVKSVEGIW